MTSASAMPRYIGPDTSTLGRKMTSDEVRARFDAENASIYNQRKRNWLPDHAYSTKLMLQALTPFLALDRETHILDLGAGTGGFTWHVLRAFRNCHATLVDFSQNMLDEAPNVLSAYAGRFSTRQADFWNMDFPAQQFDAVFSSFALHHGRGEAVYAGMYRKVSAWLKTPGIFACVDIVDGDTPALSAMNEAGWKRHMRRAHFAEQDIERLFSNYRCEDSPISVRKHLALLEAAGFHSADVLWKRFNFAVYVGVKEN